jgi:uncharacterized protein (DUF924 family)
VVGAAHLLPMNPVDILAFWSAAGPGAWFKKDAAFDQELRVRFEAAHHAAARGEFADWERDAEGALALILLLDQIPRNIYRGSAHAFATDPLAQAIADRAVNAGFDRATAMPLRVFFYLPFEHAENLSLQARCVALTEAAGNDDYAEYARLHRDIIVRFGRFPHRNAALGRASTAEEAAFLGAGGFAG